MAKKSNVDIRKFRSAVATLKRKGLITGVDARSVTPSHSLLKKIDKYDDVLSGKVTPVKLQKEDIAKYRKQGFEIAGRGENARVLYPHSLDQKVRVSHGKVTLSHPSGIKTTNIPIEYHELPEYLAKLKKDSDKLARMKKNRQLFGFKFRGNYSQATYSDIDLLIDDFERYNDVIKAMDSGSAKAQSFVYSNLQIITVSSAKRWEQLREKNHALYKSTSIKKRKRKPLNKAAHAARARAYRKKIKSDPVAYAEYRAKAKKRAKRSRKK